MYGVTSPVPPFKKILTWLLILLLISQEIFRIPYGLSTAQAIEIDNHENIVSLVVEENLYKKMKSDIEKYAIRVQSVLPNTRTVILTFSDSTQPMLIASANERLYYSGLPDHGTKTQKLVGTILIGNIPLPTVHKDSSSFLSIYPYIDFDEPNFVWNWEKNLYEYIMTDRKDVRPDIWHSVIAPHTGDLNQDIKKVQDFFSRVYEYDAQQGQYADVGNNPQALYVDSVRDSQATSPGSFAAYEKIFVPNQESFSYNRYTKEFAQYLYTNYITLMKQKGDALVSSFSAWKAPTSKSPTKLDDPLETWVDSESISPAFLNTASDISTRLFSTELIPSFIKTLSEKYIGDVSRWVHQSGRYYDGFSKVRVDTMPELIQARDTLSTQMLQQVNTTLETVINGYIEQAMSVDIPVLVSRSKSSSGFGFTYTNYFFGEKAVNLTEAAQCSLLRGSTFGGNNSTAEMNHGYHIQGAQEDIKLVKTDTDSGIKCKNLTQSYWGGNSALNMTFTGSAANLKDHWYDDFPQPVYDPAGGKRATGAVSPFDCLKTDLILEPYQYRLPLVGTIEWPKETSGKRYSCATDFQSKTKYFALDPTPESTENIFQTLTNCAGTGNIQLLGRDGKNIQTCASSGPGGTYKLISSLVKHVSPDTETYGRQLTSLATPNMPVDEERYVTYIDRNIQEKRFNYPNVFDISVPIDAPDEVIRTKILAYLSTFDPLLIPGKDTTSLGVFSHLVLPGAIPAKPSLSQLVSSNPDLLNNLIASLRWKNIPTAMKYQVGIQDVLSGEKSDKVALFGDTKRSYEISYLGGQGDAKNFVVGYHPDTNGDYPEWYQSILDTQNAYQDQRTITSDTEDAFMLSQADYNAVLGSTPNDNAQTKKSDESTDACTDENAVIIWKWLPAIQCWLKHLFDTKWESGESDFSFDWSPYLSVTWGDNTLFSTTRPTDITHADDNHNTVNDVLENNDGSFTLHNMASEYVLEPNTALQLSAYLEKGGNVVNEDSSPIEAVITKIANLDTGKTYTPKDPTWEALQKQYISLTGSPVLIDGKAMWTVRSLTNARLSFEITTRIQSGGTVYIQSEKITFVPESHFPAFTVISSKGSLTPNTINADDAQGINILFTSDTIPTTVDIEVADYLTDQILLQLNAVPVKNKNLRLGSPTADSILHKAGKYIVKMTTNGISETTDIFIAPGEPKNITSGIPPILLVGENHSLNFSLTDTWGNIINPASWNATLHTSQPVIFSGNTQPVQDLTFPLSKKVQFRALQESTITFDIAAQYNQKTVQTSTTSSVLSDIIIEPTISQSGVMKVGQELPIDFVVKTKNGTVIENWNRSLTIKTKGTRAGLVDEKVSFVGGKGKGVLKTGTQSGKTYFYLSDVLAGKKIGNDIEIAPDVPSRLVFSGPETLLARKGQSQSLFVTIFDTYGNTIHPSTVDVRIEADREDLLDPLGSLGRIEGEKYGVRLTSRGYPGRVLLRGALYQNGLKNTAIGLENVWKVQILPVISSEDVANNTWNSLTHVLLGGPFGQFVTSGYFGGSLLFAPRTSALSISTLLDNPRSGLASLSSSGSIQLIGQPHLGSGLRVAWQPDVQSAFALVISDKRLGDMARVTYPRFSDTVRFSSCAPGTVCDSMVFTPANTEVVLKDNTLIYNGIILSTLKNIFDAPSLSFAVLSTTPNIQLNVLYQGKSIGTLALTFAPRTPSLSGLSPSTFSVEVLMSDVVTDNTWGPISSADIRGVMLLESASPTRYVGGPTDDGYSAYPTRYGMGWTGDNLGLLHFASGNNWAETQKDFGDYVTVNLGDPLITLPEYKVDTTTGFDATIGVPVYTLSSDISDFSLTDLNNDQQKDVVVVDAENTLSAALSKKDGTYLDMGEFLSFENARKDSVRTGDFFGDGYSDAVYIDTHGALRLASHNAAGTQEIDIVSDKDRDIGSMIQMEVFDMDHDGRDDIVVMDILGQLSIFYGTPKERFIYQFVDHVFDFSFAEKSLFSGAIAYGYPGFSFPDYTKTQEPVLRSQQEQLQSLLFTSVTFSSRGNSPVDTTNASLGSQFATSFQSTDSTTDSASLSAGYNDLQAQYGGALTISDTNTNTETLSLLKAPFIDPKILQVSKKFTSLEKDGIIIPGSRIQGVITVKNTSSRTLSKLVIAEKFPTYLERPITEYTLKRAGVTTNRLFSNSSDGGVADLRDITLAPGETIEILYTAKFASFSFGSFDVGHLEDKNDPLMNIDVTKDKILTINPEAKKLTSIPEKDFYNTDQFGDIRINPNDTCGGPLFVWRSHNAFDRTYQKTLIVRNIVDPDTTAMNLSSNPLISDLPPATPTPEQSLSSTYAASAQIQLDTFNHDSDADYIPDRYDEDTSDVFTIDMSGDSAQITIGLGKLDGMIDKAIEGVETLLSGLSCGFGDPGCVSSPMNWTYNVPGNTITALGYAIPFINKAPIACNKDVRCGIPLFSFPTASPPYFWPPNPDKAGGMFDVGASSKVGAGTLAFNGGYGVSQFRFFLGGTLTGAIAAVLCFGPNDLPTLNLPGLFPLVFAGNCIYATQPLTQCSDDGGDDVVIDMEVAQDFGNLQVSDADSCQFFTPTTTYPLSLLEAVNQYINNPTSATLDAVRAELAKHASIATGEYESDQSLQFSTSSPYQNIQSRTNNSSITFPESGNGNGIIQVTINSSGIEPTDATKVLNINLKSISAFPRFIMDWYHRQMDEIVSSLSSLPDIKIFLPDLSSGFADGGWIPELGSSKNSSPTTPATTAAAATTSGTVEKNGDIFTPLDVATDARNSVIGGAQQALGSIQSVFEYLSLLPMVNVHPETIALDLPWLDRSAGQAWLYRNEAILAQWEALPAKALGSAVDYSPVISSIRSNMETVRSYMRLPEQLQNLFYLKEKLLYEIMKNVYAVQQLMGGWLSDNGERFKAWVEAFILITRLWDLWQVLIDVFDDYEQECAVCRNEQWNLQEWGWIVISAVVPPIPVVKMPRWPDIELDFSDINLSFDIAYPVFNFSFYPVNLPDMPTPSFTGMTLPPIPQLPPLPDLNIDFSVPTINLPKLPNLPPAPLIPKLSAAISVVLKIFKIVTLIQCLYRKIPLSPEWYVGTKIAHKTDRQGYLPIDFLNVQMPSIAMKWVDAIRVSTHVELRYDADFIVEAIRSALEPLTNFQRDFGQYNTPSSVDFNLSQDAGLRVQTSSLDELPALIGQLYEETMHPQDANLSTEQNAISRLLAQVAPANHSVSSFPTIDTQVYQDRFQKQAQLVTQALQTDIDTNAVFLADLTELSQGKKQMKDIAWMQNMNPYESHLAASKQSLGSSALLDLMPSLSQKIPLTTAIATDLGATLAVVPSSGLVPAPVSPAPALPQNIAPVTTPQKTSTTASLKKSQGLYITQNGVTKRLNYFYESAQEKTVIHLMDDDRDGDEDLFYTLGKTIYRKENYTNKPKNIYITDTPKVFTRTDMMHDFFGLDTNDTQNLPHDMQIFLRQNHMFETIEANYLIHRKSDHEQFDIFSQWGQSDAQLARYRVDSILQPAATASGYAIISQPTLMDISGSATLHRARVYRTLLPNRQYTEGDSTLRELPTDFVIRAKKIVYTKEKTQIEIIAGNEKKILALHPGEMLLFGRDSNVTLLSGSLLLPSDETEEVRLSRSDIGTPLFPDDRITTSQNGTAQITFSDATRTTLSPNQEWSFIYHTGAFKIQDFSLPVSPGWYYVVAHDAFSPREHSLPHATLFDAYTDIEEGTLLDTLPTTLQLKFDSPTEIDFQQYFPIDTITKVDVSGISDAFWRRESATKIIFETLQKSQSMILKVTGKKGTVSTYAITLATEPAQLMISDISDDNMLSGTISENTPLPLTIQSYVDKKSWTISSGVVAKDNAFSTSFGNFSPTWDISYDTKKIFSLKRDTGVFSFDPTITLVPEVKVGYPLALKTVYNQKDIARVLYQGGNLSFQQIAATTDILKNTLSLLSSTLRLETSSTGDTALPKGAYIVDNQYRPLLAFDAQGVVRYLDTNIRFTVGYEGNMAVFTILREGSSVGKIYLSGDMLTAWDS